ncbi:hypothetical protein [Dapis sp. BLCC M172]|uniref:class I SAM-dependent methyltransferase n=1 Tax=Dapis sp. BLCC M172 TaxID=2975281 RepID=UPI003CF564C6
MAATIEKKLEETQQELDQTKSELHDVREELERSQSQLDEVLGELEQTHFDLHQLKEKGEQQHSESDSEVKQELEETKSKIEKELEETQAKWQHTQRELDQTKSELHDVREELERSQSQLDEVLGELEQTHFDLHQLKEKGEQQHSESNSEVKQKLEETKSKFQETEHLLEQSQSQLDETMGVLEEYQFQMEKTMATLEESQGKLQQKQEELEQVKGELAQKESGSESNLKKELEETKSKLRETEQLLKQYQSQLVNSEGVVEKYLQTPATIQDKSTFKISKNMPTRSRSDRLNKLATINQSSRYLEIGVSKGTTFNAIKIENKVAVDPKFLFNQDKYANDKVVFREVSSDEFFRSYAKDFESFDLIYLDGLHTFVQTFRDFCASLACGHSKTIWLIDDTFPGSYAQAQSSLKRCRQIQKFSGENDGSWMGDVFKIVAAINDFFPQYSFATFPDHGQTVVWKKWRADFEPIWNNLETITRLEYSDFVELQSTLFKREPYDNIFERIRHDFSES